MPWIPILSTDLSDSVAAILQSAASGQSLADPFPATRDNIVGEIRACVGFSGRYTLDVDSAKIPSGMKPLALRKIVREMSRTIGRELTEDDRTDEKTYESRLDATREGRWPVEPPDNPASDPVVQNKTTRPAITVPDRYFSRDQQVGF